VNASDWLKIRYSNTISRSCAICVIRLEQTAGLRLSFSHASQIT